MAKKTKKKIGRPPKHEGERLSKNRTFRVRGMLDEYLTWNAEEAGRSVSEEIEARLERSFHMDGLLETFAGDAAPIVNALATTVAFTFLQGLNREERYRVMQVATGYIIAAFGSLYCPTRDKTTSKTFYPTIAEMRTPVRSGAPDKLELTGVRVAHTVLKNLGMQMPEQVAELAAILKDMEASK
jgi:hypothetical protein